MTEDRSPRTRDIEESASVLDHSSGDPVEFWEKKQRELVTSVVDYNLPTLASLISSGDIELSPHYQRRLRWDDARKSRLIESFLMNVPVPPVFLNEDAYGQYSVIDGKQRLNTINEFLSGKLRLTGLEVFSDINNATFDELPRPLQSAFNTRPTLRAVIVLRQSDPDIKFEVFQRLNTGGVRLNPQEIRNSAFPGPLNDLILDLSVHPLFHRLLGITSREKSSIYVEMRDAEFVLRYFTFRTTWQQFMGGMRRHMDAFMEQNQRINGEELVAMRNDFLGTLQTVEAIFGEFAFRRWVPGKDQWRRQILASLFDAEMFAAQYFNLDEAKEFAPAVVDGFKELFSDPTFARSIDQATNTPSYFQARIAMTKQVVEKELGR